MAHSSLFQAIKFTLFSISAGIIQLSSCALFLELLKLDYWVSYLLSLILSILWNFTLNRQYTFKSAANIPIAMTKVFLFYLVFTPLSTYLGDLADKSGINEYLILIVTMLSNFVLEFLFCKFVVYKNQENTLGTERTFGMINGEKIQNITIKNEFLQAEISTYGATLVSLLVKGKNAEWTDVCLGYDTAEEYAKNGGFFGATIGRFANRIGNAKFTLNGVEYSLAKNNGENTLHGGKIGFDKKIWKSESTNTSASFTLISPDGDENFPGEMKVCVTYSLVGPTLEISYNALCDKDTPVSLTNHSYFNISGHNSGDIYDQTLQLFASHYTPTDKGLIPTGEVASVDGTVFDLRDGVLLGDVLNSSDLSETLGFDHNFALDNGKECAAILYSPKTQIEMICKTDLPGIQIYTAGGLKNKKGKNGAIYKNHNAICLETQHFPDAPNKPNFPSVILKAGDVWESKTTYTFTVK